MSTTHPAPTPPPSDPVTDVPLRGRGPGTWRHLCAVTDLERERGRAALVEGTQVALFLLVDGTVRAVGNLDPFCGAHVISRGIVGSRGAATTISSPMFKQVFDLRTGHCLDAQGKPPAHLPVWPVQVTDGEVHVLWED